VREQRIAGEPGLCCFAQVLDGPLGTPHPRPGARGEIRGVMSRIDRLPLRDQDLPQYRDVPGEPSFFHNRVAPACLSSSSFVTTRSRFPMSASSISRTFGASATGSPLRNKSRLPAFSENGPKSYEGCDCSFMAEQVRRKTKVGCKDSYHPPCGDASVGGVNLPHHRQLVRKRLQAKGQNP